MPVILFHGNNLSGYLILLLFLIFQTGIWFEKQNLIYELKKNQKEFSLVLEELERKNNLAVEGV